MMISKELKKMYERKNSVLINDWGLEVEPGALMHVWTTDEIKSLLNRVREYQEVTLAGETWRRRTHDNVMYYECYEESWMEDADGERDEDSVQTMIFIQFNEEANGYVFNYEEHLTYSDELYKVLDPEKAIAALTDEHKLKLDGIDSHMIKEILDYDILSFIGDGYNHPVDYKDCMLSYVYDNDHCLTLMITSLVNLSSVFVNQGDLIVILLDGTIVKVDK